MDEHIPTESLTESDIPGPEAGWHEILKFAASFDGYKVFGEKLAPMANGKFPRTADEARGFLFYEYRRYRHFGTDPEDEALDYIKFLVKFIRAKVASVAN